ncbi:MAG: DUF4013 domain-containing protein [Verrucomicrobia bacterium]|jgi:hypothetical protein|nr:DUF4013 domain-containing protein [Verrucomicrobiota bacterium]
MAEENWQMENREKISWGIWRQEGFGRALLIGGLLSYIPVLNLLVWGYFADWAGRLQRREGPQLPEWKDGRRIVQELVRILPLFLLWVLAPLLLGGLLTLLLIGLFDVLQLDFFAYSLGLAPMAVVAAFVPPAFVVALLRMNRTGQLRDGLTPAEIVREVLGKAPEVFFPLIQFYGILALGWPLFGFAFFLGALPLIAQMVLVYGNADAA